MIDLQPDLRSAAPQAAQDYRFTVNHLAELPSDFSAPQLVGNRNHVRDLAPAFQWRECNRVVATRTDRFRIQTMSEDTGAGSCPYTCMAPAASCTLARRRRPVMRGGKGNP